MLLALVATLALAPPAPSTTELLKSYFPSSERVTYLEIAGSDVARLGVHAPRAKYVVYYATTAGKIDGFAVVDDEKGQHEPITFAIQIADGRVVKADVLAYREAYGGEIRDVRFLRQLKGKSLADPLKPGVDVDGISGATISTRSTTIAVKRALALASLAHKKLVPSAE